MMSKKLGQYFLNDKTKIKKIVDALDLQDDDIVIEIGAGHGELTKLLAKQLLAFRGKLFAIEKDPRLINFLIQHIKIGGIHNTEIIQGDVLKILPKIVKRYPLKALSYKIVGNIPYYITGYLLRLLGDLELKPLVTVLTVQKEVAERICAKPPKMNLLAASVQFWATPEIVGYISKKDFSPMPKVDSAVIKLTPARIYADKNADFRGKYYNLIKILFKQPRKTILNNLSEAANRPKNEIKDLLKNLGIGSLTRAQELGLEQIQKLTQFLSFLFLF